MGLDTTVDSSATPTVPSSPLTPRRSTLPSLPTPLLEVPSTPLRSLTATPLGPLTDTLDTTVDSSATPTVPSSPLTPRRSTLPSLLTPLLVVPSTPLRLLTLTPDTPTDTPDTPLDTPDTPLATLTVTLECPSTLDSPVLSATPTVPWCPLSPLMLLLPALSTWPPTPLPREPDSLLRV